MSAPFSVRRAPTRDGRAGIVYGIAVSGIQGTVVFHFEILRLTSQTETVPKFPEALPYLPALLQLPQA